MKYVIDTDILNNNNLTLAEFGLLLYFADLNNNMSLADLAFSLWEKGYLTKEVKDYCFEPHSFEKLQVLLAEGTNPESVNNRAENLADKLRDIYPNGRILNTNYYYRSNKKDVINKLKTFFTKYGNQYTDEQIINATKKYVESFNGNYAYLKLLKYFIWKDERAKGESVQSLLADFIENEGAEDTINDDWTSTLRLLLILNYFINIIKIMNTFKLTVKKVDYVKYLDMLNNRNRLTVIVEKEIDHLEKLKSL